jgi:hypothetical protein
MIKFRSLTDYWSTFAESGLSVEDFEEPKLSEEGRVDLPSWAVRNADRIPHSCVFVLAHHTKI